MSGRQCSLVGLCLCLLTLGSCASQPERAGCPPPQQFGHQGAEWRLCPLEALTERRGTRLVGLALGHTLTTTELQAALERHPVRIRVVYFAAGDVRGTWAQPQAQAASIALRELERLRPQTTAMAQAGTRQYARQVIASKALTRVLNPATSPREALQQLGQSSLRYGVLAIIREHQSWQDAQEVALGSRGWVCGLQVQGPAAQVAAFARTVGASGFTLDRAELFNSLRPADPPDLRSRLKRWPGTLSETSLLRLGQAALHDFHS